VEVERLKAGQEQMLVIIEIKGTDGMRSRRIA